MAEILFKVGDSGGYRAVSPGRKSFGELQAGVRARVTEA